MNEKNDIDRLDKALEKLADKTGSNAEAHAGLRPHAEANRQAIRWIGAIGVLITTCVCVFITVMHTNQGAFIDLLSKRLDTIRADIKGNITIDECLKIKSSD